MTESPEPTVVRVEPSPAPGVVVLALAGELDLAVHGRFHSLVDEVVAEAPHAVVADLAGAGFMDSTMLRELLRAHSTLGARGVAFVVAGPQAPVRRLLELTGADAMLTVTETREQALAHLDGA